VSAKLQTLEEWARSNYEQPPSEYTLRRWVKAGKIFPAPEKQGRAYFVVPHARYVGDFNSPSFLEAIRGATSTQ
jgi:hypothetical protein